MRAFESETSIKMDTSDIRILRVLAARKVSSRLIPKLNQENIDTTLDIFHVQIASYL